MKTPAVWILFYLSGLELSWEVGSIPSVPGHCRLLCLSRPLHRDGRKLSSNKFIPSVYGRNTVTEWMLAPAVCPQTSCSGLLFPMGMGSSAL